MKNILVYSFIFIANLITIPAMGVDEEHILSSSQPVAKLPMRVLNLKGMVEAWRPYQNVRSVEEFIKCWSKNLDNEKIIHQYNSAVYLNTRSRTHLQVVHTIEFNVPNLLASNHKEYADFTNLIEGCIRRLDHLVKSSNAPAARSDSIRCEILIEEYFHPFREDPMNGHPRILITVTGQNKFGEVNATWQLWPTFNDEVSESIVESKALGIKFQRVYGQDATISDEFSPMIEFDGGAISGIGKVKPLPTKQVPKEKKAK